MLYIAGPALVVLAVGFVLALPAGVLLTATKTFWICQAGLFAVAATIGGCIISWALMPKEVVANGPIGATCPAVHSAAGQIQGALVICSLAFAAVAVAGAIASAARGHRTGTAIPLGAAAAILPYFALLAWVAPRLCDYS